MKRALVIGFWVLVIGILAYTRFVNLGWGLPYPFHPDERNMAVAVQDLHCSISNVKAQMSNLKECLNPHFFAYGQFPLYLGRIIVFILKFFDGDLNTPVGFGEAVISLRIISAVASILNVFIVFKIIQLLLDWIMSNVKSKNLERFKDLTYRFNISHLTFDIFILAILTFTPYAIQLSHFGTTESLLMLFYSLIIFFSLRILKNNSQMAKNYWLMAILSGLAVATKISSVIFLAVPVLAIILCHSCEGRNPSIRFRIKCGMTLFILLCSFAFCTLIFAILFSPHNLINFKEFLGAIGYESDVALGRYVAFYSRQFVGTVPVVFQMTKIFPYALGWPQFILAILGFFLLPWKNKFINFLRFAILAYFLPNAFVFAKWTRFMSPIFPVLSVFAVLFLFYTWNRFYNWTNSKFKIQNSKAQLKTKKFFTFDFLLVILPFAFLLLSLIIPGLAYLSIYRSPDVRFQASEWIYKNIPNNNYILSETANVVDIPIPSPKQYNNRTIEQLNNYRVISFNFYDLDESPILQEELKQHLEKADYIFVPSRRIFANLQSKYPLLNKYYDDLFSGRLGFTQVAEFTSYPKIDFGLLTFDFGLVFPDEAAEETWSVFDHPVIRIYKKAQNSNVKTQMSNQFQNPNDKFLGYKTTPYTLRTTPYTLLIADTPQKQIQGLMNVRSKEEIGADGMIFIFNKKEHLTFWNKNTVSDLDVYWLNDDQIVGKSYLPSIEKTGNIVTVESPSEVNKIIEIIR